MNFLNMITKKVFTTPKLSASLAFYYIFILALAGFAGMYFVNHGIDIQTPSMIGLGGCIVWAMIIIYNNRKDENFPLFIFIGSFLILIIVLMIVRISELKFMN